MAAFNISHSGLASSRLSGTDPGCRRNEAGIDEKNVRYGFFMGRRFLQETHPFHPWTNTRDLEPLAASAIGEEVLLRRSSLLAEVQVPSEYRDRRLAAVSLL
jgi:hypothetical protein